MNPYVKKGCVLSIRALYVLLLVYPIIIGLLLLLPLVTSSSVLPGWQPGIDWGRQYIVDNGRIYDGHLSVHFLPSSFTIGAPYYSKAPFPSILYAMVNTVTGTTSLESSLSFLKLAVMPFTYLLWQPLIFVSWFRRVRDRQVPVRLLDLSLVFLLPIFPLASQLAGIRYGYVGAHYIGGSFTLAYLIMPMVVSGSRPSLICLLLLLPTLMNGSYTGAVQFTALFATTMIFTKVFNHTKAPRSLGIIVVISYFLSALYLSEQLMRPFYWLPSVLRGYTPIPQPPSELLTYRTSPESAYTLLQAINLSIYALASIIFALNTLIPYIQKVVTGREGPATLKDTNLYDYYLLVFLISTIPQALLAFPLQGIYLAITVFFWMWIPLAILTLVHLLATKTSKRWFFRGLIIVVMVITSFSYINPITAIVNPLITNSEYQGITYLTTYLPKTSYVLSDFRLAPTLIYGGHRAAVSINTIADDKVTKSLFYGNSAPEAVSYIARYLPSSEYSLLLSSKMTEYGVLDPGGVLKPAHLDFERKFELSLFNKVYSSNYVALFQRSG